MSAKSLLMWWSVFIAFCAIGVTSLVLYIEPSFAPYVVKFYGAVTLFVLTSTAFCFTVYYVALMIIRFCLNFYHHIIVPIVTWVVFWTIKAIQFALISGSVAGFIYILTVLVAQ